MRLLSVAGAAVAAAAVALVWSGAQGRNEITTPVASASASPVEDRPEATPAPAPTGTPGPTETPAPQLPVDDSPDPEPSTPPHATTDVTISYIGWVVGSASVEASAYASVIESGGSCTLTLVQDDRTVVSTPHEAAADATSTACGTLSVPRTGLAPGTWTATVSYRSSSTIGTSTPTTAEVPQ